MAQPAERSGLDLVHEVQIPKKNGQLGITMAADTDGKVRVTELPAGSALSALGTVTPLRSTSGAVHGEPRWARSWLTSPLRTAFSGGPLRARRRRRRRRLGGLVGMHPPTRSKCRLDVILAIDGIDLYDEASLSKVARHVAPARPPRLSDVLCPLRAPRRVTACLCVRAPQLADGAMITVRLEGVVQLGATMLKMPSRQRASFSRQRAHARGTRRPGAACRTPGMSLPFLHAPYLHGSALETAPHSKFGCKWGRTCVFLLSFSSLLPRRHRRAACPLFGKQADVRTATTSDRR